MKKPINILLFTVAILVLSGIGLWVGGSIAKTPQIAKIGRVLLLVGIGVNAIPLFAALIYFGWKKLFGRK